MFCWIFRFIISNTVDAGNGLSNRTQKHVRTCKDCRSFYEACLSLDKGLRSEAADFDEDLPVHFARRVFDAASAGAEQAFEISVRWFRPALAAACVVVVASLAAILLTVNHEGPTVAEPRRIDGISRLMDDGRPTAWAGLVRKPLSDELDNVTQGTESAVRFLVACVAVNPSKTNYKLPD